MLQETLLDKIVYSPGLIRGLQGVIYCQLDVIGVMYKTFLSDYRYYIAGNIFRDLSTTKLTELYL